MAGENLPMERPGEAIRVLIIDSSLMENQLLAEALGRDSRFSVVGMAETADTALAALRNPVDVVVVSATVAEAAPEGNLIRRLLVARPGLRVVVLLERPQRNAVVDAFRAGASGIFCRAEPLEKLWKCIESVHRGKIWADDEKLKFVLEELTHLPRPRVDAGNWSLTEREQKIIALVAEGLTNRQIAAQLRLNNNTLKSILRQMFEKFEVSSRAEMVFAASVLAEASDPLALEVRGNALSNDQLRFDLYVRAAGYGFPFAQLTVGRMCLEGRGTVRSVVAAYAWLLQAEKNANEIAERSRASRESLTAGMSEEQVAEAEQIALRAQKRPGTPLLLGEDSKKRRESVLSKDRNLSGKRMWVA